MPFFCMACLQGGDFFVGGVVAGTLTKLMLRLRALNAISGERGWSADAALAALLPCDAATCLVLLQLSRQPPAGAAGTTQMCMYL